MIKPTAHISNIRFTGGDEYSFGPQDKIVIVGSNNSGKSQTLRDIVTRSASNDVVGAVAVSSLSIQKTGTSDELRAYLNAHAESSGDSYQLKHWRIHPSHLSLWPHENLPGQLSAGFLTNITAHERLQICRQQSSIASGAPRTCPQHVLYDDEAQMAKVSALFRRAFGKDLMIDFRGGNTIPMHVGEIPAGPGLVDRVGDAYVHAVRKNPTLDSQGDGMKGYAGILFEAIVSDLDITLIDEPEAFLHPPQMRRLGETLAEQVRGQLFVATHSSDILRGFLDGAKGNVRVLRIQREEERNRVTEARAEVVRELWQKPDLRYSNALEGLFHEQTIICEDDSDCRLLNAMADHLASKSTKPWKDTAYVPTGGKKAIAKIAGTLHRIGVPVKAVFDLDFLSDEGDVRNVVEAFGGEWGVISDLYRRVNAAVRDGCKPKSASEIKSEIVKLLENSAPDVLPKSDINEVMKQTAAWHNVKRFGEIAIPSGEIQDVYRDLVRKLESLGVFLIPVGEIEKFCPSVGSHGPKFVTKLLEEYDLASAPLSGLRAFVERVHLG